MVAYLRPCPHCGGSKFQGPHHTDNVWWLVCLECEAGMEVVDKSEEYLVASWNRRPSDLEHRIKNIEEILSYQTTKFI